MISRGIDRSLSHGCQLPCFFLFAVSPAGILTRSADGRASRSPWPQSGLLRSLLSLPPSQHHPSIPSSLPPLLRLMLSASCSSGPPRRAGYITSCIVVTSHISTWRRIISPLRGQRVGGLGGLEARLSYNSHENASQELHRCRRF